MLKVLLAAVFALISLLISEVPCLADDYEDQCVVTALRQIPAQAQVSTVSVGVAAPSLIQRNQRDPQLRWVQVDFGITIGNRKLAQHFICAKNRNGDFIGAALVP